MQKERPRGVLTEGFYSLEKYRHSLEKSGYAYFFSVPMAILLLVKMPAERDNDDAVAGEQGHIVDDRQETGIHMNL